MDYNREKIVGLVHRWGNSAAEAALDLLCSYFSIPEMEGVIPYRLESGCAVIFGDPICAPENVPKLSQAFHDYCAEQSKNIIYVVTTEKFAKWAVNNLCGAAVAFGEELTINPSKDDPTKGPGGRVLRQKIRRALREEVSVHEYVEVDPLLEKEIEGVAESWLEVRKGPQVYISHISFFRERLGKRWFYTKEGSKVTGVATLHRLESREGWLLNRIVLTKDAAVGSSEILVSAIIEKLEQEECNYLTFGAVPAQELCSIHGFRKISSFAIRTFFGIARKVFHLDGKRVFWQKFQPKGETSYVLFGKSKIKIKDVLGIIRALNMSF